jgi:hypothetical protein
MKLKNGKIDWQHLNRFEPRSRREKWQALFQNVFESRVVLSLILVSGLVPSLVSLGLTLLSHNLLLSSTYVLRTRLQLGLMLMIFNILILTQVIRWKLLKFTTLQMVDDPLMKSALGIEDKKWASFKFEMFICVQYLRVLYRYFANILYLTNLDRNRAEVVLMKNHEF